MARPERGNKNRQKKDSAKKLVALALVLVVCIGVVCKIVRQQIDLSDYKAHAKEIEQNTADEQLKNQKLQDQLEQVEENPDEQIQRLAREKLGLVKPNERVFVDISQ